MVGLAARGLLERGQHAVSRHLLQGGSVIHNSFNFQMWDHNYKHHNETHERINFYREEAEPVLDTEARYDVRSRASRRRSETGGIKSIRNSYDGGGGGDELPGRVKVGNSIKLDIYFMKIIYFGNFTIEFHTTEYM